ncbi:hypothetical protein Pan189_02140 [Stratiformator vulcanicus]|uniref:Uncharacterized protein n=2 Tax=Stratiformator vulcanicus TaxID=2527980 RepID=A0A517QW43_9PLAN|nr:hypothetical protein Pan189_02140 [Stratiformator vulcanicus]
MLTASLWQSSAIGQEAAPDAELDTDSGQAASVTPAQVVILPGAIDATAAGRVRNVALRLQQDAAGRDDKAILVLEIHSGSSRFGAVYDLAAFLTSAEIADVRTIAWIPEEVNGNNAALALACNEIVMHPDASLGDLGRGGVMPQADLQFVMNLVDGRHNPRVNRALVAGMGDPAETVLKIKLGKGDSVESRVVTLEELKRLQEDTDAIVSDVETLKDAGAIGRFTGRRARALDILITQTASDRTQVAELYGLPSSALRPDPTAGGKPKVAYIKIAGVIEPILAEFIGRQIDRSVARGVNLIIFEIDSPGGYLQQSKDIAYRIADLEDEGVRTVAYVPDEALSGAAIISLGCDEIYLHPGATIGDAGPIEVGENQQFERAPEKVLSFLRKILAELAEMKGRPEAVAMAMADKDLLVYRVENAETGREWYMTEAQIHNAAGEWIKQEVVESSREDNLLTVGAEEAHTLKIAEPPVADQDELRLRLGLPPDMPLRALERTWLDTLVFILNTDFAMAVLVGLGIILIYLELHFLTGLLGILSALCFSLFFWARFLGGTADWLEVVLFGLGIACLAMEFFVIPGFGVFGVSGGLLILGSLVMATQTFGNIEPGSDFNQMANNVGWLGAALATTILIGMVTSRFLPHIPLFRAMILAPPGAELADVNEPRLDPSLTVGPDSLMSLIGRTGKAATTLRPSGKALIEGDYVDVVSDGGYIDADAEVEVVGVEGNRVIVREA